MEIPFERIAAVLAVISGVEDEETLLEMIRTQTLDEVVANRICAEYRKVKPLAKDVDHERKSQTEAN